MKGFFSRLFGKDETPPPRGLASSAELSERQFLQQVFGQHAPSAPPVRAPVPAAVVAVPLSSTTTATVALTQRQSPGASVATGSYPLKQQEPPAQISPIRCGRPTSAATAAAPTAAPARQPLPSQPAVSLAQQHLPAADASWNAAPVRAPFPAPAPIPATAQKPPPKPDRKALHASAFTKNQEPTAIKAEGAAKSTGKQPPQAAAKAIKQRPHQNNAPKPKALAKAAECTEVTEQTTTANCIIPNHHHRIARVLCFSKFYARKYKGVAKAGFFVQLPTPAVQWKGELPAGVTVEQVLAVLEGDADIQSAQLCLEQQLDDDEQFGVCALPRGGKRVRWTDRHAQAARAPVINGAISNRKRCGVVVEHEVVQGRSQFSVVTATLAPDGDPAAIAAWYKDNVVPRAERWELSTFENGMLYQPDLLKRLEKKYGIVLDDIYIGKKVENVEHPVSHKLQKAFIIDYNPSTDCCSLRFGDQTTADNVRCKKLANGTKDVLASGFCVEGRDFVQEARANLSALWSGMTKDVELAFNLGEDSEFVTAVRAHAQSFQALVEQHFGVVLKMTDGAKAKLGKKTKGKASKQQHSRDTGLYISITGKPANLERCISWMEKFGDEFSISGTTFTLAALEQSPSSTDSGECKQEVESKPDDTHEQRRPEGKQRHTAAARSPSPEETANSTEHVVEYSTDGIEHHDQLTLVPASEINALRAQVRQSAPSVQMDLPADRQLLRLRGAANEVQIAAELASIKIRAWATRIRSIELNITNQEWKFLTENREKLSRDCGVQIWTEVAAVAIGTLHAAASSEDGKIKIDCVEASMDDALDVNVLLTPSGECLSSPTPQMKKNGVQQVLPLAQWDMGECTTEEIQQCCVALTAALTAADQLPLTSISIGIPSMRSGLVATAHGVVLTMATNIVQTVLMYLNKNKALTKLRRVVFTDQHPTIVQDFASALQNFSVRSATVQTGWQQHQWKYRDDAYMERRGVQNPVEALTAPNAVYKNYESDVNAEIERRYQSWLKTRRNIPQPVRGSSGYEYLVTFNESSPHYQTNTDLRFQTKRRIVRLAARTITHTSLAIKMQQEAGSEPTALTKSVTRQMARRWDEHGRLSTEHVVANWLQQHSCSAEILLPESNVFFDAELCASCKQWLQSHATGVTLAAVNGDRRTVTIRGPEEEIQRIQEMLPLMMLGELTRLTKLSQRPPQQTPFRWTNEDSGKDKKGVLVAVASNSEEWRQVLALGRLHETMPNVRVVSIQRVENRALWDDYALQRDLLQQRRNRRWGDMHTWAWHGTRTTDPEIIANDGIDFRFADEGLWGRGAYTAHNASYSHMYAHRASTGLRRMFLVNVMLGETRDYGARSDTVRVEQQRRLLQQLSDQSMLSKHHHVAQTLRTPPAGSDSVTGFTNGSKVYIVYETRQLYPAYLIGYFY